MTPAPAPAPASKGHALVAFSSLSGNTREVARFVEARLKARGMEADWMEIGLHDYAATVRPGCALCFLGSWSVDEGRTPSEVKEFVHRWVEQGQAAPVAVFGTGETQWGEEFYCGAVHRLARFFKSPFPVLAIEQMPHGEKDTRAIEAWVDTVLDQFNAPERP